MQKTNSPTGIGRIIAILSPLVLVALLVALLAPIFPRSAFAVTGSTFETSSGITAGQETEIGASLQFCVLSDPANGNPGTVQVGNGVSIALDATYGGAVTIPESVEMNGEPYVVTSCASNSFISSKIRSVTIPSTLKRICSYAFFCCYDLAEVAFQGESSIAYIEGHAFEVPNGSGALAHIRFPASLRSIGVYSFFGQSSLTDLSFEGDSLERIAQYAFANCRNLKTASIPALTAPTESFGAYCFTGCSNLEYFEFRGNVASFPSELIGTRYFDDCTKLATVVYRGKKVIPCWKRYGSATDLFYEFTASDPALYYTITYYPSLQDAELARDPLGAVCVRSDTRLCDIVPGMARSDADGAIIHDGEPLPVPEGFDAWAYESNPAPTDEPTDSLYAYPSKSTDLASGTALIDGETYPYTATAVKPEPIVHDVCGTALERDRDYTLAYQRKTEDGTWVDDASCIDVGDMRVIVAGAGAYEGEIALPYTIAHAQAGDAFTSNGITYQITVATDGTAIGEASIGDGTSTAVPVDMSGAVTVPETVQPDGSLITYQVTGVSSYAFGSNSVEGSCGQLTGITLPSSISTIGTCAFGYCTSLSSFTAPANLQSIGARAFQNCIKLGDVQFDGVELQTLGTYSFAFCTSLSRISLPSIGAMRDNVFAYCTRLSRVDFLGSTGNCDGTQFSGCSRLARIVCHTADMYPSAPDVTQPSLYGVASFTGLEGEPLGEAVIRVGTPLTSITPDIERSSLLEGAVPPLPSGYSHWGTADSSITAFPGTCALVPAVQEESAVDEGPRGLPENEVAVGGSGAAKAKYRVISNEHDTVVYVTCKSTKKKTATIPATVTLGGIDYSVVKVAKKAFKGTKVKTVKVKSKSITSFKKAFSSSKVKKVVAPKSKKKAYKKLLAKKACGRSVKIAWK